MSCIGMHCKLCRSVVGGDRGTQFLIIFDMFTVEVEVLSITLSICRVDTLISNKVTRGREFDAPSVRSV